jgi:hypothetical protein
LVRVVSNPGTPPARAYYERPTADTIVAFEGSELEFSYFAEQARGAVARLKRLALNGHKLLAQQQLVSLVGCPERWAKIWVNHLGKAKPRFLGPPCPHCAKPLRTPAARQCPHCLADWHEGASANVDWDAVRDFFEWDGSWRDLYVFGTTVDDWDRLLSALRTSPFAVTCGEQVGSTVPMPQSLKAHFEGDGEPLMFLSVIIEGITLNAHMFAAEEIEFDLDPREIAAAPQFGVLLRFMNFLADTVGKPVVLTPENGPQHPVLVVRPGGRVAMMPTVAP